MKSNALTVIHKYIRGELFDVSCLLSRTGPKSAEDAQAAIEAIAELLRGHAEHEEVAFGPLMEKVDASLATRMTDEHRRLDEQLDEIGHAAAALGGADVAGVAERLSALHLDWNRFAAQYLMHLDEEERTLFPVLGPEIPPVEYVAQGITARGEGDGGRFLVKLSAVITEAERMAIAQALAAG